MQFPPLQKKSFESINTNPLTVPTKLSSWKIGIAVSLFLFLSTLYFLFPLYQKVFIQFFSPTFTMIVLPDTQHYSASRPELFCAQTQWIVDNIRTKNIVFVSHVGDIVNGWKFKKEEWDAASTCLGILDGKIPYNIVPGNHDTETGTRDSGFKTYDTYFPVSRYDQYEWYKGNRRENANSYQMLNIFGIDFLFLALEIEPTDNTLKWANEVVDSHPYAYTILTTHKYLPDAGIARDTERAYSNAGNTGEDIWNKLIRDNCSVRLVWSGHFHTEDGEAFLESKNACGIPVYQTMQDYQSRERGGNAKLRIYTFNPNKKEVRVQTYSPATDSFEIDSSSDFTFPFHFNYKYTWWRI